MRVLIDNCVPKRLASAITGHDCTCVVDIGWAALPDGTLLDRMAGKYDVLVTVDRGLRFQQRLSDRTFAIIILRAPSNRLADLRPLIPTVLEVLPRAQPGLAYEIRAADPP